MLLEHMHKNLERQGRLPSSAQVKDMKDDLDFKKNQLENAETTYARLKVEMEDRHKDLEKIQTLESRIEKEMEQATERIASMEDEMNNKFTQTDGLKEKCEQEKVLLAQMKKLIALMKPGMSKQMTYHSMQHDTKKNQILQNDIYNKLNDIEKKLIGNESQIYAIQQYIEAKGAETNLQGMIMESMTVCNDINMEIIKKSLTV